MPRRVAPETYVLADGVALDYDQVADIVGTPSGRPVRYVPESLATKNLPTGGLDGSPYGPSAMPRKESGV